MVDLSAQIHPAKNLPIVTYRNPSTKVLGDYIAAATGDGADAQALSSCPLRPVYMALPNVPVNPTSNDAFVSTTVRCW